MAAQSLGKISLFSATIALVKKTASDWWPWVLILGLFHAALRIALSQYWAQTNIAAFMQAHPELKTGEDAHQMSEETTRQLGETVIQNLPSLMLWGSLFLLLICLFYALAYYVFAVIGMQKLYPEAGIRPNFRDFLYWLGKVSWKYTRPILWLLLPIIGLFFYVRSTVKYALVSPLSLLRSGEELKTSWDLTEGNWWRIFGNQLLLGITIGILAFIIVTLAVLPALLLTHGVKNAPYNDYIEVLRGLGVAFAAMVGSCFSCAAHEVITQEKAQNNPADS